MYNNINYHQYSICVEDGTLINSHFWTHNQGGSPVFFLLHDLGGSSQDWNSLAPELTDFSKGSVEVPDQRGHGLAIPPNNIFTPAEFLANFESFFDWGMVSPLDQPVILGQGWSGLTSLAFAANHPELVYRLVLIDSPTAESRLPFRFGEDWKEQAFNIDELAAKISCPVLLITTNQSATKAANDHLAQALHNSTKIVNAVFEISANDLVTQRAKELAKLISGFFLEEYERDEI